MCVCVCVCVCGCVCVYLIEHNRHSLSTYFLIILSNCRFDITIFGGNWLINLP